MARLGPAGSDNAHVYFGEAFVVVRETDELPEKLYQATRECASLDWRVHDLVLVPVPSLETEEEANGE